MPVLRLFFAVSPTFATTDSLFFVFANTLAASITFLRQRVVDTRRGAVISIAAIPTSILGAYVVRLFSARDFDVVYGIFLVAVGVLVLLRRNTEPTETRESGTKELVFEIVTGIFVGFFSSFFGIGGGIVLVPVMLVLFRQPVHTVAATSAFVVMLTSPIGVVAHAVYGDVEPWIAAPLVLGGLVGGTSGAHLARRMKAHHLTAIMASLLFAAALALVIKHLM